MLVAPSLGAAPEGVPLPGKAEGNTCCHQPCRCTNRRRSTTTRQGWGQHLLLAALELPQKEKEHHYPARLGAKTVARSLGAAPEAEGVPMPGKVERQWW
eukprot:gene16854-biopygen8469